MISGIVCFVSAIWAGYSVRCSTAEKVVLFVLCNSICIPHLSFLCSITDFPSNYLYALLPPNVPLQYLYRSRGCSHKSDGRMWTFSVVTLLSLAELIAVCEFHSLLLLQVWSGCDSFFCATEFPHCIAVILSSITHTANSNLHFTYLSQWLPWKSFGNCCCSY